MQLKQLRISEKKVAILQSMGIKEAMDLLTYYPFRYEEIVAMPFSNWEKGARVTFEGLILTSARVIRFKGKQSVTKFKVLYQEDEFDVSIYNRPWVSTFIIGKKITLIAKYEGGNRITVIQYNFQPLCEQIGMHPVYNCKEGIHQKDMQKYIDKAWEALKDEIVDFVPADLREKYRLISRKEALFYIHHPSGQAAVKQSLRHLKYEEFLRFQLAMQAMKADKKDVVVKNAKCFSTSEVMRLKRSLAFTLTIDQDKVIAEILADLKSERVMYRMLQGDVGCGKTMVAAFGMYACVLAHKQAAFLAPTEILAKQHAKNLKAVFADFEIHVDVLYASMKAADKKDVLTRLAQNDIDILVGTHALFQEDVTFYDLGMAVADEQHRFGVSQRRLMLEKGDNVDFLFMSATPIPRTLAISLYGDMDVSTIAQLPKGRKEITTKVIRSSSMSGILQDVLEMIDKGNQCYVVCPAIEKNDDYAMRNVTDIYQGMQSSLGKRYKIALLHGKMQAQEKDDIMQRFVANDIQILVSTTVIEVGVDVKNANIMVIYDAHRFGLSQIHQLRGRVGRGEQAGYCYLLTGSNDPDSLKRLKVCEQTSDGFEIARYDLQMRGPGDILGTRQSGVPGFILGDIIQDANILEIARQDVTDILKKIDERAYQDIKNYIELTVKCAAYLD